MLTNTYECLAIILRSLRLVANCIRNPIRLIFATFWRICREYIFLHSQGYSPQCESRNRSCTFIGMKHVSPTFMADNIYKNPPAQMSFHLSSFLLLLFRSGAPPMNADCWSAHNARSKTPASCAPLMHVRVSPPPNQNPDYAGESGDV